MLLLPLPHYGRPRFPRTDNEACFTSMRFRLGLRLLDITLAAHRPRLSLAERPGGGLLRDAESRPAPVVGA